MKAELDDLVDQMITRGILFEEAVKEFEKSFILSVVNRNRNNLSKAASELKIHRNTLSKRLLEYENSSIRSASKNGHKRRQIAQRRRKG
jgi:DNA-binding NtrC family response regulator